MFEFSPASYGGCADVLRKIPTDVALAVAKPKADLSGQIDDSQLFPNTTIADPLMADCCRSGLLLAFDCYEDSHGISQDIETTTASYWHAILHRREPDMPNAKYWFRRVGSHVVYDKLNAAVQERIANSVLDIQPSGKAQFLIQQSSWDAIAFVDLCESAIDGDIELTPLCNDISRLEWQLLFDYTYHAAIG